MDISVIVPTHNRKDKLEKCLRSLFQQDYPIDGFEVIVVDDGSSDGTDAMLKRWSREQPLLRYVFQDHKGPAAARNLGTHESKGEIVAFTDNDCVVEKDWVKKMVEAHRNNPAAAAVGGITKVDACNIKAVVSQFLSNGAVTANVNGGKETIFFPTCNVSFKKRYLENDGFNELFPLPAGEDLEFFWRLFKKGVRFASFPDIEIRHDCHSDFGSFLRQAWRYGRGNYLVQHIHKDHPLLKEIRIKNHLSFFAASFINFIKIPRFSWTQGMRLLRSQGRYGFYEKFQVYCFFALHKIVYIWGNVAEHLKVALVHEPPEYLILDITHRCNLSCNICEIRKDASREELSTAEVKDLIGQAAGMGVKEFVLSGGEAFLRDDIFQLLEYVKEKRYSVGILTNGIILDEPFVGRLLPYLVSGTLSLSISLDSLKPEIHDDIRGAKGSFDKTVRGLKILSSLKKEHPSVNFNVISIILNRNLEELSGLLDFLKSLDVNSIQLQPLLANNLVMKERTTQTPYWIPQERLPLLDKTIDAVIGFKRENKKLLRNSEANLALVKKYFRGRLSRRDVRCRYVSKAMLISSFGEATTCFDCYGDVRKRTLESIYLSREAAKAKSRVLNCAKPCLLPCFCDY